MQYHTVISCIPVMPVPLPKVRCKMYLDIPDSLLPIYLYNYILEVAPAPGTGPAGTDYLYIVARVVIKIGQTA
jgi:hypothetical protein